ncbi:MAG: AAA family ATPase [Bullifex sp.]
MREMISLKEFSEICGISLSRAARLCREGRIEGAIKKGKSWMIPADSKKPDDARKNSFKGQESQIKPLPIGVSSFSKAVTEYFYIDKTLMIKELIDSASLVSLFTRPRRFGKSLNMDMLRVFFEKTEEKTDVYFRDKKIWRCGENYRNLQGKYPVIYLSFKDAEGESWDETFRLLKQVISMEYRRHPELDDPKRNSLHGFYTQIISGSGDESVYMMSLYMLSEMLYLYHGEETVVIIDEYDTPITHSFMTDNYTRCVHFMRNMLSGVLKDNRRLKYGIMSGVLRLAKESIFSGLNNLKVYSILDNRFSEYFGFTEEDVRKLLKCFGREDKFDEVLAWYDGYIFGNTEIFNPWSVLMYISNDCEPDIFWLSTSDNAVIKTIIGNCRINGELVNLMHGSEVETVMDTAIPYPSVTRGAGASLVMSFLSVTGYLKARQKGLSETGDRICSVMIPNREIMTV